MTSPDTVECFHATEDYLTVEITQTLTPQTVEGVTFWLRAVSKYGAEGREGEHCLEKQGRDPEFPSGDPDSLDHH